MTRVHLELMYGDYTIYVTVLVEHSADQFVLKERALEKYLRVSGADAPEKAWVTDYEENV
jgi:hypothetical protein